MSLPQLFYSAATLQNHKWRFKYGRQATEVRLEK